MIGEKLGHLLDKPLEPLAQKIPLTPNTLSVIGFLITLFASYVLTYDLGIGGILIVVGGCFDMLDGIVARITNSSSRFGAFLDSVLDRYADAVILLAIAWNLGKNNNHAGVLLCLGTLIGSFLISYARARAEGLGMECKHGLMERPERIILIAIGTITGIIMPILWILLILTHMTVFQRVHFVWKHASKDRSR